MPMKITDYLALNLDQAAPESVNGCSNADVREALNHPSDFYTPSIEAQALSPGLQGHIVKLADWSASRIYPHSTRDIWFYRPVSVDSAADMKIIVFNDGAAYLSRSGAVRATRVLDHLHHTQAIGNTIAAFINPGVPAAQHVPDEEPVPGELGHHPHVDPVRRVGAGIDVAHERLAALEIGQHAFMDDIEMLRRYLVINRSPPDIGA